MSNSPIPVLVFFGPTASGKTRILLELFGSSDPVSSVPESSDPTSSVPKIKAEIISADSMQVYRGMDIGTAKPSTEERAYLPHHLIDIRDPCEQFNAGDFVRLAREACKDIASRGSLPVVSGGTGFYLKNLIFGLSEAPPSNKEIRAALNRELQERGALSLMEELAACDPISAKRIHINDEYRLLRALEVYRTCGQPLSSFTAPTSSSVPTSSVPASSVPSSSVPTSSVPSSSIPTSSDPLSSVPRSSDPNFRFIIVGLSRSREELYCRINERCAQMFKQGLVDEVRNLYEAGYTPNDPGLRAIGYREFFIQDGKGGWRLSQDLNGVQALIAQNSRRYAKRQITFFKNIPGVQWVHDEKEISSLMKRILRSE